MLIQSYSVTALRTGFFKWHGFRHNNNLTRSLSSDKNLGSFDDPSLSDNKYILLTKIWTNQISQDKYLDVRKKLNQAEKIEGLENIKNQL